MSPGQAPRMRVAMVCVGVGVYQRGLERCAVDLHQYANRHLDAVLYQGAGPEDAHHRTPQLLPLTRRWMARVPGFLLGGREYIEYKRECAAYALALIPELLRGRFDVIDIFDPPLGTIFSALRFLPGLRGTLLFLDGSAIYPELLPRGLPVRILSLEHFDEAIAYGVPREKLLLGRLSIDPDRMPTAVDRAALRRQYGIPDETFVILQVSALRRIHKRTHHLIEEASQLPGDVLLWLDGAPEDEAVVEMARRRLGPRLRITRLPSDQVCELFALCDVSVHCAFRESFGLVVSEAMWMGAPVIAHNAPHFEWLTQGGATLVDMSRPGALRDALEDVRRDPEPYRARARQWMPRIREWLTSERAGADWVEGYREFLRRRATSASTRST